MQAYMDENIVENWLRSLDLVHYTQAFIDNGYDDLEICKQVGDADLDAIEVFNTEHRTTILEAVDRLRQYGGTHVYFILDPECQKGQLQGSVPSTSNYESTSVLNGDECKTGGATPPVCDEDFVAAKPSLLTYPKLQLTAILHDKLAEDCINLADYVVPIKVGAPLDVLLYAGESLRPFGGTRSMNVTHKHVTSDSLHMRECMAPGCKLKAGV